MPHYWTAARYSFQPPFTTQLKSLELYAGTLLHEALHAKYTLVDVSRDFEYYLTELCGKLAATIIQENR